MAGVGIVVAPPAVGIGVAVAAAVNKRKADAQAPTVEFDVDIACTNTLTVRPGIPNTLTRAIADAAIGDEEGAPLIVAGNGFRTAQLNARFVVRADVVFGGRRTYWTEPDARDGSRLFIAWQKTLSRWAICLWPNENGGFASESGAVAGEHVPDVSILEFCEWRAFQLELASSGSQQPSSWICRLLAKPGLSHLWMERDAEGSWHRIEAQISSIAAPPLASLSTKGTVSDAPQLEVVDIEGFRRLELNARYTIRNEFVLNGKPSYWDATGKYFVYWQVPLKRWGICGRRHLEVVKKGQCLGCACQLDQVHLSIPARWAEYADGAWLSAPVEVVVWQQEEVQGDDVIENSDSSRAMSPIGFV